MFLTNFIVVIITLISTFSGYFDSKHFWLISLIGLAFPFLFILNILFIFYWILIKPKLLVLSLITILLGTNIALRYYKVGSDNEKKEEQKQTLKVMSYNVRLFGLYDYYPDWSYNFDSRNNILKYIKNESYDIMCFQEAYYDDKNEFLSIDSIQKLFPNYHIGHHTITKLYGNSNWGAIIISKYPIINQSKSLYKDIKSNNVGFYVDIKYNNDTIRVYNCHLQSIKLDDKDYEAIRRFDKKTIFEKLTKTLYKFKIAYEIRSQQINALTNSIKESKYPVIMCTDLNDTPNSFAYTEIKSYLNDSFVKSGKGFSKTYINFIPFLKIDYIFYSKHFESKKFETDKKNKYSDHYPIKCELVLK